MRTVHVTLHPVESTEQEVRPFLWALQNALPEWKVTFHASVQTVVLDTGTPEPNFLSVLKEVITEARLAHRMPMLAVQVVDCTAHIF